MHALHSKRLAILTTACLSISAVAGEPTYLGSGKVTLANNTSIDVEIAAEASQRERGLMYRKTLAPRTGMLFIYPETKQLGVWMKNTLLPLDVLFLSEQGRVLEILKRLPPCKQNPCLIYRSNTKARYMLETDAGFSDSQGITEGQDLILEYSHTPTN